MKRIITIIILICFGTAFAQFDKIPQYEFNSTSPYECAEYNYHHTFPTSEIQQPFYTPQYNYIRRAPEYPPSDPGWEDVPVGDVDLYFVFVMLFSYFIYNYMKKEDSKFLLYI